MSEYVIDVGGRRLSPVSDLESTKSQILAAVQRGGGFVEFSAGRSFIGVLETPSTAVSIHSRPAAPVEHAAAESSAIDAVFPSFDDYEDYGI